MTEIVEPTEILKPTNWAAIFGRWSFNGEQITYMGPDDEHPGLAPFGLCVTNIQLAEGRISCRAMSADPTSEGRILLGYRSPSERYILAGLMGWKGAYSIAELEPSVGWRPLSIAGSAKNITPNQWHKQIVELNGQRVRVSVDEVRVLEHVLSAPVTRGQVGLFAFGSNRVEFDNFTVEPQLGTAFVVLKFCEPYQQLYKEVIQPVVKKFGLRAYHVGEVFGPGIILQDIADGIIKAQVVIAEITPANKNVYYELGYAHALGKPTIMLSERGTDLPFDISGYRVLMYDNTIAGKTQVEHGLTEHLKAIFRE